MFYRSSLILHSFSFSVDIIVSVKYVNNAKQYESEKKSWIQTESQGSVIHFVLVLVKLS